MYENNFMGYPAMNPGGVTYGQQRVINMTQPLSAQDIAQLRQKGPAFSLAVDPMELMASACTHKENNKFVVQQQADGSFYCPICGETFKADWTKEQVEEAIKIVCDQLQTIKLQYLNIPEQTAKQYFAMIPLLKKAPKLFEIAANEFAKNEQGSPINQQNDMRGFGMLNMLTNPMAMYNPQMMGQPQMQPMYQQPYVPQQAMAQPQMQPGFTMPTMAAPNGVNPFQAQDPSAAQQPAMTAPATAVQPADNGVVNSKVLNV